MNSPLIMYSRNAQYENNRITPNSIVQCGDARGHRIGECPSSRSLHQGNTVPPSIRGSSEDWVKKLGDSLYRPNSGKAVLPGGRNWTKRFI